ncbi:MAG: type II toxin-antitoxin system MqsA family antitoxin [Leptospirales bacterium]
MKCVICREGDLDTGFVTVKAHRRESLVMIKEVPADICQNCGEYYLDQIAAQKVYEQVEDAVKRYVEVEVLRYEP